MAAPTEQTIRHTEPYLPPAITGLTGLLDQHVRDRPESTALVVGGGRIPPHDLPSRVDDEDAVAHRPLPSGCCYKSRVVLGEQ